MYKRVIPKVFYESMSEALDLFVDGMRFTIRHQDGNLTVVARDESKVYLVEDKEYAAKDRPELAIETDAIDEIYADVKKRRPDLLHPNSSEVAEKPWGAKEFALLDKTKVCVIFRQW